jgi:hypothetical protein
MIALMAIVAPTVNLHTLGRNGHDNHPNVPSLGHCDPRGTKCDVIDVKGVFVIRG